MDMSEISIKIGNTVKKIRTNKGLSQEQLAELSNLHRTHIGFIERSERAVTVDTLEKLAEGLDMALSDFFKAVEDDSESDK